MYIGVTLSRDYGTSLNAADMQSYANIIHSVPHNQMFRVSQSTKTVLMARQCYSAVIKALLAISRWSLRGSRDAGPRGDCDPSTAN